ncbi:MAG: hypothetical protein IKP73_12075, partial [Bacteroidales bacterium]|nr:hypothetical protein [Bacteroidales bacterium]
MIIYNNKLKEYIIDIPGSVNLGDVVDVKTGAVINKLSEIDGIKFNIKRDTEIVTNRPDDKSDDGSSEGITFNACIESNAIGGGWLNFQNANSAFIRVKGVQTTRIKFSSLQKIKDVIKSKYQRKDGSWEEDWCIVTNLRLARKSIIVTSTAKNAKAELLCQGCGVGTIDVGNIIDFNISFNSCSNIGHKYFQKETDEFVSILYN